jgi:hypothetical protein
MIKRLYKERTARRHFVTWVLKKRLKGFNFYFNNNYKKKKHLAIDESEPRRASLTM